MPKAKVLKVFSPGLAMLALLVFASCAAPAAVPSEEQRAMQPVVKVTPITVAPMGKIDYIGANFEPGENVKVTFLYLQPAGDTQIGPIEIVVATDADNIKTSAAGTFYIKQATAPEFDGVWPVRVYDQDGNVIAAASILVKTPPKK